MSAETIIRPNGKPYTPRKGLRQIGFSNEDGWADYVAVLGTHNIQKALAFGRGYRSRYLIDPQLVWVKRVMRNGEPWVATDAVVSGAAAVLFTESDDPEQSAVSA